MKSFENRIKIFTHLNSSYIEYLQNVKYLLNMKVDNSKSKEKEIKHFI